MAEKRKVKRRKEEDFDFENKEVKKPTKEEIDVAKWMKKNVPVKKTKFAGHNVEYFTGSKAVDALLESEWSKKKGSKEPLFSTRQDIINFLNNMLRHKLFHRAKKVPVSEQELKKKLKKKDKEDKKKKEDETAESSHAEGRDIEDKKNNPDERQKKCKKIKLEMHFDQMFVDNLDAYVWIFDPIPFYYWIIGFLVVIGAIGICLFPLWPPTVRMGVQYLSMAAAGLLILILALAVIRLIVFCIVWSITCGTFHLWLLPNLTEDVGFFASFWPLYEYKYGEQLESGKNKKNKKKKAKDSDNEEETGNEKITKISEKREYEETYEDEQKDARNNSDNASQFENEASEDIEHNEPEYDDQQRDYSEDEEDSGEEGESNNSEDSSSYKLNESPKPSPRKSKQKNQHTNSNTRKNDLSRNESEETDTESSSQHSQTGKDFEFVDREDSDVKS